jgi:hypothetical protein
MLVDALGLGIRVCEIWDLGFRGLKFMGLGFRV